MTKATWKQLLKRLQIISSWYFIVGLIVSSVVAVVALRNNNTTALRLRDTVNQADKDNGDVEAALKELRTYVYSHMNTSLASGPNAIKPPVQLKYRYDRLVEAEKARVSASNAKIYTDAQATCEKLVPDGLSGRGRVPCIQDYVTKHGVQEQPIPDALYKFDFASPLWSPDLAGFAVLFTGLFAMVLVVRLALEYWLRYYVKNEL